MIQWSEELNLSPASLRLPPTPPPCLALCRVSLGSPGWPHTCQLPVSISQGLRFADFLTHPRDTGCQCQTSCIKDCWKEAVILQDTRQREAPILALINQSSPCKSPKCFLMRLFKNCLILQKGCESREKGQKRGCQIQSQERMALWNAVPWAGHGCYSYDPTAAVVTGTRHSRFNFQREGGRKSRPCS